MKRKREDCTHAAPMTGGAEPYRGWREGGVRGGRGLAAAAVQEH